MIEQDVMTNNNVPEQIIGVAENNNGNTEPAGKGRPGQIHNTWRHKHNVRNECKCQTINRNRRAYGHCKLVVQPMTKTKSTVQFTMAQSDN